MGKTKLVLFPILLSVVIFSIGAQQAFAGPPPLPMPGPPNDVHAEWSTGQVDATGTPTIPVGFSADTSTWPLFNGVPTQATCVPGAGSTVDCTFQVQNLLDNLAHKQIRFDISNILGLSHANSQVICHDSTGDSSNPPTQIIPAVFPDLTHTFIFECEPNPDWEEIQINLLATQLPNLQFQIWTQSFGDPDFGDAPDGPYRTLIASSGPSHAQSPLFMNTIDYEPNGQPSAGATGDDPDDNDGVSFDTLPLRRGELESVTITHSGSGQVYAWLDKFTGDGVFKNSPDRVINAGGANNVIGAGSTVLMFTVPPDNDLGDSFMRFRICDVGPCTGPAFASADGEVEDYKVIIEDALNGQVPDPPTTVGGTAIPIDTSALLLASAQSMTLWMIPVVVAGIGIGVFVIKKRS